MPPAADLPEKLVGTHLPPHEGRIPRAGEKLAALGGDGLFEEPAFLLVSLEQ